MDPKTGVEYRGREYPWGVVNIEDQVGYDDGYFDDDDNDVDRDDDQ